MLYDWNIFGSSSKVFSNLRKFLNGIRQRSCDLRASFGEFSEIFRKYSREKSKFGKSSKTLSSVCPIQCNIVKRMLHGSSKKWILWSCGKNNITLAHCAHLWDIVTFLSIKHKIPVTSSMNACSLPKIVFAIYKQKTYMSQTLKCFFILSSKTIPVLNG